MERANEPAIDLNDPSEKARRQRDIQPRTFRFALQVIRMVSALPKSAVGQILGRQLARSATSVGANVEEAEAAHSKREFIRRMNIARSEMRESVYWLRLICESELMARESLRSLLDEGSELVRILTAIVRNARK